MQSVLEATEQTDRKEMSEYMRMQQRIWEMQQEIIEYQLALQDQITIEKHEEILRRELEHCATETAGRNATDLKESVDKVMPSSHYHWQYDYAHWQYDYAH